MSEKVSIVAVRPPSLRAIAAFEAAARHGTFHEAACELNLTDSAVGYAVRGLEARLGQILFRRDRGGLRLTAEGRALAARVTVGLALLAEAFDTQGRQPRSRLVVSVMPAFAERFLSARLLRFWEASPETHIDLRSSSELVDLAGSDVDLCVRYGMGRWAGVRAERLTASPLIAVASPHYRGGNLPMTQKDLARCDLLEERHTSWRPVWGGGEWPVEARRRLKVDDIATALGAAQGALGVALAPWIVVADDIAAGRLVQVTSLAVPSPYGFWLAWMNSSDKPAAIASFAAWLQGEVAELCPEALPQVA